MKLTPALLKWGMSAWPPFLGAGIRVTDVAPDWTYAVTEMRVNLLTRNAVGTAFGGSMSAMTDPLFMLLLRQQLGQRFVVWDVSGEIEFLRPGRGRLTARMEVPADVVARILAETANGDKSLTWFTTSIMDSSGTEVATVRRKVYARKTPSKSSP